MSERKWAGPELSRDQYVMMTLDDLLAWDHRIRVVDELLERVTLHIAQQHFFHLAVDAQLENRGIEPLVLRSKPQRVVVKLDGGRRSSSAVNDCRGETAVT